MDAKRAPVAKLTTPAAMPAGADDRSSEEHSWLVFRLGPHTMCASTLDVEGIIESKPATPLPFTPGHVLGTFLFRNRVATAISLRRKLAVRVGEDSAQGPFIVARVGDELAAFWVDEVKEVMGEQNVTWQPMPDMLRSRVFDRYTLARDELILHTSFASLLAADAESIPAGWRASAEEVPAGEAKAPLPAAGVRTTARDAQDDNPAPSTAGTAPPAPPAVAGAGPQGAPDGRVPQAQARGQAARDQPPNGLVGESASTVPPPKDAPDRGVRLRGTARTASQETRHDASTGFRAGARAHDLRVRAAKANIDEARRHRTRAPLASSVLDAPLPLAATMRDDRAATAGPDDRATPSSEAIFGHRRPAYRVEHPPSPAGLAPSHELERGSARPRMRGGLALVVIAGLVAMAALWWRNGSNDVPPATENAENRVRGPIVAEVRPQRPTGDSARAAAEPSARPVPSDPVPRATVSGPAATRIATVASEAFSLTIERPAKTAARVSGKSAQVSAGTAAATSAGQPDSTAGIAHVVVRGDTLWNISRRYLGNPFRYPELVRLSGIKNPNLIHPGDIVRIRVTKKRR